MIRHRGITRATLAAIVASGGLASSSFGGAAVAPAVPADVPVLTLEDAIDFALTANKGIAAARLGTEVARAGVDVAKQRPNPELTFEAARETPHDALTIALPIETGSKRARRVEVAEASARGTEAEIARFAADIRVAVRRAYYAVVAARRRLDETEELLALAARTLDAARDRFGSGAASQLEVLQAELAAAEIGNEARDARGALGSASGDLNTLLARPPQDPISVSGELDAGTVPDPEAAIGQAMSASVELGVLDRGIEEGKARVRLARAQRIPDLVVHGGPTYRSEPEFAYGYRAGLSIVLPIQNHRRAEVHLEEQSLGRLEARREAVATQVRGEVYGAIALASSEREQYRRYREEILPKAVEVERMAEDSYRSGQTNLVAMLQALQTTRDLRIRAVQSGYAYQSALADLERAIGAPLP